MRLDVDCRIAGGGPAGMVLGWQARREAGFQLIQQTNVVAIQNCVIAEALAGRTGAALRIARVALRHLPPLRRTMARVLAVGQRERLTAGPP